MTAEAGPVGEGPRGGPSIVRAGAIMGLGTLLSRVTGYVRSILLVSAIGLQLHADLFTVANTIPNALYILVAGGVLNAVLVPQLVRAMKNDADGGQAYANRVFTLVGGGLLILSVLAVLAAPWLIRLYAPGELYGTGFAEQRQSLEAFARLCLPQIAFYGIYVLVGQVLNARDRFGPMMFAPVANNVIACGTLAAYLVMFGPQTGSGGYTDDQELLLGLGSTLGVAVQAAVLWPVLRRSGFRFRPRFDFRGTGLGHTGRLAVWTVLFVVVNQIAYLVVTRLAVEGSASVVAAGEDPVGLGATVYQNAFLVLMVPHALVTVSLVTALLPRLSRSAAADDLAVLRRDLLATLRLAVAFAVLAGAVLLVLAPPVARLLFGWGAGAGDTEVLGHTLMAFVPGLVAFTIHFVVLRGFYALEDTRTPFLVQCAVAGTNVVVALAMAGAFDSVSAVGLAGSFSFAYGIGAVISSIALANRLGGLELPQFGLFVGRAVLAAAPAAAAAIGGLTLGQAVVGSDGSRLEAALAVGLAGGLAIPTFLATAGWFGLPEVAQLAELVTRRLPGRRRGEAGVEGPALPETARSRAMAAGRTSDVPLGPPTMRTPATTGPGDRLAVRASEPADTTAEELAADVDTGIIPIFREPAVETAQDDRMDARENVLSQAAGPGTLLAGRYRLEELLASSGGTTTWRGQDEVLSRPVAVHLLDATDPRAEDLAQAARAAAGLADPHFLRVLDVAVEPVGGDDWGSAPPDPGGQRDGAVDRSYAYVVREWVPGRNLAHALADGPFDADDAVYVARELTAAMASAHQAGLAHLRLEPDTVVLADTGQVKVIDLGVDRVLRGVPDEDPATADGRGIGRVLYACLTGRWPDGPVMGLPAAPTQDGRLCSPRQVLAGVPGPLDEVCDRILGEPPRAGREPLRTPTEIDEALDYIVGRPVRRRPLSFVTPSPARVESAGGSESTPTWRRPDVPPTPVADPEQKRSPVRAITGAVVAIVLLVGALLLGYELAQQAFNGDGDPEPTGSATTNPQTPTGTTSAAPSAVPVDIVVAQAYDPVGDGEENDGLAPDAIDGDSSTGWTTVNYFDPMAAQGKAGVGLVLDLGEVRTIDGVELELLSAGGAVELRVLGDELSDLPSDPDDWTVVATATDPEIEVTLTAEEPVDTRYVLIWFTDLPPSGEDFKGGVNEAVVLGR